MQLKIDHSRSFSCAPLCQLFKYLSKSLEAAIEKVGQSGFEFVISYYELFY
jgi:hypothetical protein